MLHKAWLLLFSCLFFPLISWLLPMLSMFLCLPVSANISLTHINGSLLYHQHHQQPQDNRWQWPNQSHGPTHILSLNASRLCCTRAPNAMYHQRRRKLYDLDFQWKQANKFRKISWKARNYASSNTEIGVMEIYLKSVKFRSSFWNLGRHPKNSGKKPLNSGRNPQNSGKIGNLWGKSEKIGENVIKSRIERFQWIYLDMKA